MSGHNKWSQIKHQKETTDQKRGQLFSKLLKSIALATRANPNPNSNLELQTAIKKAKDANVPLENIERAIRKSTEKTDNLEELVMEAYGHGGVAILIEAITDSKNRTVAEIKKILNDEGGKWAEAGSVRWAFEENRAGEGDRWKAKFPQAILADDMEKLNCLVAALKNHADVQKVYTTSNTK